MSELHKRESEIMSNLALLCYERLKNCTKDDPFIAKELADELGLKEANVRSAIRDVRLAHIRVCSNPNSHGYWLEENGGGYDETRNQMLSRAFRIFEVVKAMDEAKDGQYEWVKELGSTATYGAIPKD